MGKINGSQKTLELQAAAREKLGVRNMSAYGVLLASLNEDAEPGSAEARFWTKATVNACRVIMGVDPIEDFT